MLLWCARHEMLHAGQIGLLAPNLGMRTSGSIKLRVGRTSLPLSPSEACKALEAMAPVQIERDVEPVTICL